MQLRSTLAAALFAISALAPAFAQSATFDLKLGDRVIGRDSFSLSTGKGNAKLSSHVSYHINGQESASTNDFRYSDVYVFLQGGSSNDTNQTHYSFQLDKSRTDITIGSIQAGAMDSKHLPTKPDLMLLPVFDAGAAQAALLLAIKHPSDKNLYSVFVPASRGGGSAPAGNDPSAVSAQGTGGGGQGNFVYDALFQKGPDATGTLDGKPVTLHSYTLTSGQNVWTFYADDSNTLMQADASMLSAHYVRAKFALDAAK